MKICLIGSSRFKDLYDAYNRELTLAGHVVYSIAMVSTSEGSSVTVEEKLILDLVHLRKIQLSDTVVVVTDDRRYVGESTRREFLWARILGRPVYWSPDEVPRECYPGE